MNESKQKQVVKTKLTDEASIEKIISEMTVWEKAACITGDSSFYTRAMEEYGIPRLLWLDGGTGVNTNELFLDRLFQEYAKKRAEAGDPIDEEACTGRMGGLEIVLDDKELWNSRQERAKAALEGDTAYGCYPPGILFGATWDPEVIEACGHELGKEANVRGVDVLLGTPNVNIHRDPLGGWLFEGYSEDPCLVASLAPFFVKGVMEEGVVADVKHFAANNQETDRMGINEHIPERALREIYFPGFKACVEAGCQTVMSAYNQINGVPCAQNRWLLTDVLRGEWGFDGCVVTDWSAAYDQVEAAAAGNDLIMPGPRQLGTVVRAVEEGVLPEEKLDGCVRNFLRVVLQTPSLRGRKTDYDIKRGVKAAYEAAKEGMVLLKNSGVLPLKPGTDIAFFGERSRRMVAAGAGSAMVNTSLNTNVYDSMAARIGGEHVSFGEITQRTGVIVVTVGANGQEGADRVNMRIEPEDQTALDEALKLGQERDLPVVVLLNIAAPVQVCDWEDRAAAILCMFLPGMQGGEAAADILLGRVNPSGKLPLTFPRVYEDCPTSLNFPGYDSEVWYGEGIYVGYRYYEKKGIQPMYPFGFGLSYTTFSLLEMHAPEQVNVDEQDIKAHVKLKNTGNIAGSEVVQLYVHDPVSTLDKPYKELKAFRKVYLEPGQEKEITLTLSKSDLASYDTRLGKWAAEPGEYRLLVGNASDNILAEANVLVQCANPYGIGPLTDIVKVVSDPEALRIVEEETGIVLREAAGSYIVFQPLTPFCRIWESCILPLVDQTRAGDILQNIYRRWEKL